MLTQSIYHICHSSNDCTWHTTAQGPCTDRGIKNLSKIERHFEFPCDCHYTATKRKVCLGLGAKIRVTGKLFCRKIGPPISSADFFRQFVGVSLPILGEGGMKSQILGDLVQNCQHFNTLTYVLQNHQRRAMIILRYVCWGLQSTVWNGIGVEHRSNTTRMDVLQPILWSI